MALDARVPLNPTPASRVASFRVSTPILLHNKAGQARCGRNVTAASGNCCDPAGHALIVALMGTCRDASLCCQELGWMDVCS